MKKKVKIPADCQMLGCDLFIEIDEEYDGHAEEYAEMAADILSDIWHTACNSVPKEWVSK